MGEDHYLFLATLPLFSSNRACHDTESLQKELNYYVLLHCGQKYLVCHLSAKSTQKCGCLYYICKEYGLCVLIILGIWLWVFKFYQF